MSFRALSYTLINLLHGYPYFCFEIFVLAEILPRTCTIWLFGRERLGASSMFLWVCVVMRSSLGQWVWLCVPLFVFVTDCLCVPILVYGYVCSNLGIWVWLCVPILVFVSDCVFQSWYMCLTVCSSFGQCVWPCAPFFVYIYDCLCVPVLVCLSDRVFLILCLWSSFCPCVRLWDWRVSVSGDMALCSSLCHLCCLIDIPLMLKWYLNEMLNFYMTYV